MNNPALPHAKNASSRLNAEGRSARKNFPHFNPRNPLKSLDSDERIQGNPNESNRRQRGFCSKAGHAPRKSK
jgi:hypothetical protein